MPACRLLLCLPVMLASHPSGTVNPSFPKFVLSMVFHPDVKLAPKKVDRCHGENTGKAFKDHEGDSKQAFEPIFGALMFNRQRSGPGGKRTKSRCHLVNQYSVLALHSD